MVDRLLQLFRQAREMKLVHRWRPELRSLTALSLIVSGVWAFAEVAEEVMEGESHAFDRAILLSLRSAGSHDDPLGPAWLESIGRDFTAFGSVGVLIFILLAAAGFLALQRKYRSILLLVSAVLGGWLLSFLLKIGFDRPRPDLVAHMVSTMTPSFPSGHALLSATTYLTIGVLLARVQPGRALKIYLMFLAILMTLVVGVTRVYLGVHWPTDVLAGWTVGGVWALTCLLVADWLQRRGKMDRNEW